MATETTKLLASEKEMCKLIGISTQTCWRRHQAIKAGGDPNMLPPSKTVASRRYYPYTGIYAWAAC